MGSFACRPCWSAGGIVSAVVTKFPHDALFKSVFQQPENAAAELQHVLPAEHVSSIDWSTLKLEPGSFVDEKLADQHSDLLFPGHGEQRKRRRFRSAPTALQALRSAVRSRRPPAGLVHHSNRGSQDVSDEYLAELALHNTTPSMSRKGDCWDNAVIESVFATFKSELGRVFASLHHAQRATSEHVDFYNYECIQPASFAA